MGDSLRAALGRETQEGLRKYIAWREGDEESNRLIRATSARQAAEKYLGEMRASLRQVARVYDVDSMVTTRWVVGLEEAT